MVQVTPSRALTTCCISPKTSGYCRSKVRGLVSIQKRKSLSPSPLVAKLTSLRCKSDLLCRPTRTRRSQRGSTPRITTSARRAPRGVFEQTIVFRSFTTTPLFPYRAIPRLLYYRKNGGIFKLYFSYSSLYNYCGNRNDSRDPPNANVAPEREAMRGSFR